jgi:hypothetical protein
MKIFTTFLLLSLLFISNAFAGYNTPGTGVRWNLDDLVANSGGVVTFGSGFYTINDTVKISKNDTLYITVDATVKFALNKSLAASGVLFIDPPTNVLFTALDTNNRYTTVRIDSNSATIVRNLTMEYASGGLRIADCSPLIDSCTFRYNNTVSTFQNGTIALFRSSAIIQNCLFMNNSRACIQGGANIANAPKIYYNVMVGNNMTNQNVPQINIGQTGTDTCKVIGNQILRSSTNSGGIGFLPIGTCNAYISGNKIINNRYGITLNGGSNINAIISYNQIDSNNTQNNPNLGGSGISFSGGGATSHQNSIVTGNLIRWNLWGITVVGNPVGSAGSRPNIGNLTNADTTDDGKNVFVNNTNGTTPFIDLYNNSNDSVYAQGNYWNTSNLDSVALKIFDVTDNPALGPVYWTPIAVNAPGSPTAYGSNGRTGNALYYFANSLPEGSPSPTQPEFSWRDTTGSTSLIVNKINVGTLGAGTVSDGRYDITGQLGGDAMRFFGTNYTDFYIGTDGIIGFNAFNPVGNGAPPSTGVPQANITNAIFPLWMDFDYASVLGIPINRLSYKITPNEVIITFDNATVATGALFDFISFQVIIQKSLSPTQNSRIIVQYDDLKTGINFISSYNNNTLPAHFVGLQGIFNGTDYASYRFRTPTTLVTAGKLFGSSLAVAFGPDNNALPVELASFTSSINNNNVELRWQTINEMNNSGFDIERRTENSNAWTKIGNVAGNGTTNEIKNYSFDDNNLQSGQYNYRLKQIDFNGNYQYFNLSSEVIVGVPEKFELSQNYPNPFNPVTKINYSLPIDGKVSLKIFDVSGREVASIFNNEVQNAGYYTVTFNAGNLSSGVYFYRLISGNFSQTKKLILLK